MNFREQLHTQNLLGTNVHTGISPAPAFATVPVLKKYFCLFDNCLTILYWYRYCTIKIFSVVEEIHSHKPLKTKFLKYVLKFKSLCAFGFKALFCP